MFQLEEIKYLESVVNIKSKKKFRKINIPTNLLMLKYSKITSVLACMFEN